MPYFQPTLTSNGRPIITNDDDLLLPGGADDSSDPSTLATDDTDPDSPRALLSGLPPKKKSLAATLLANLQRGGGGLFGMGMPASTQTPPFVASQANAPGQQVSGQEATQHPFLNWLSRGVQGAMAGASTGQSGARGFLAGMGAANTAARQQSLQNHALQRQAALDQQQAGLTSAQIDKLRADTQEQMARAKNYSALATPDAPKYYPVGSQGYVDPQGAFHPAAMRPAQQDNQSYEQFLVGVLRDPNSSSDDKTAAQAKLDNMRAPKGHPAAVFHGTADDGNGNVSVWTLDPDTGEKQVVPMGRIGSPDRQPTNANLSGHPATRYQFGQVEQRKNDRLADAEEQARKSLMDVTDPADRQAVWDNLAKTKNQIQQQYLGEVQALDPNFDPSQATPIAPVKSVFAHPALMLPQHQKNAVSANAGPGSAPTQIPAGPNGATAKKIFPKANLVDYSKKNGWSQEQAKSFLQQQGYTLQ